MPRTVVIRWQREKYEAIATYSTEKISEPTSNKTAGVDLGEVHMAVAHDGENCMILNGRKLRSVRRYQNKTKARLSRLIDTKRRGGKRRQRVIKSKRKQLRKLHNQIRDIQHKQTTALVSTLHRQGVQTVVIGDVRNIRENLKHVSGLRPRRGTRPRARTWPYGAAHWDTVLSQCSSWGISREAMSPRGTRDTGFQPL
ncbi:MAG: transposase [bacterium]